MEVANEIDFEFDSRISLARNIGYRQTPSNFMVVFNRDVTLKGYPSDWELALTNFHNAYTWDNIATRFGNNEVKVKIPGTGWKTIKLGDGTYRYLDIEDVINSEIGDNKDSDGKLLEFKISLFPTTIRTVISVPTGFELDLTIGDFHKLLGFNPVILKDGSTIGDTMPDITRSIDFVSVTCDLVDGGINTGRNTNTIFSFPTASFRIGDNFEFKPQPRRWCMMRTKKFSMVNIKVLDHLGREIEFKEGSVSWGVITIRPIK